MNSHVIVLIVVISIYMCFLFLSENKETFISGPCPNCGRRNRMQCFGCSSCGWCTTPDGRGECVPGDQSGPYFRRDCVDWQYSHSIPRYDISDGYRPYTSMPYMRRYMPYGYTHHRSRMIPYSISTNPYTY